MNVPKTGAEYPLDTLLEMLKIFAEMTNRKSAGLLSVPQSAPGEEVRGEVLSHARFALSHE